MALFLSMACKEYLLVVAVVVVAAYRFIPLNLEDMDRYTLMGEDASTIQIVSFTQDWFNFKQLLCQLI